MVGRRHRRILALDLGLLRRRLDDAASARCWSSARCREPSGSPAPASTTPGVPGRAHRRPRRRRRRDRRSQTREQVDLHVRRSGPTRSRGCAPVSCASACTQGDRVVGLPAEHPRDAGRRSWRTASLGAIWSSCAPEFGPRSVIDRFAQLEPTVLLAVDGYRYGDKDIDSATGSPRSATRHRPAARRARAPTAGARSTTRVDWDELHRRARHRSTVVPVPFDHPLCVLFSSGTTGLPKAIVHGHGGILLEASQEPCPQLGPRPRRSPAVVHHHGVDDVERVGLVAARRRVDRLLDGNPILPDLDEPVADRRGDRRRRSWGWPGVHHGLSQGRARARPRLRSVPLAIAVPQPARRCRPRASSG